MDYHQAQVLTGEGDNMPQGFQKMLELNVVARQESQDKFNETIGAGLYSLTDGMLGSRTQSAVNQDKTNIIQSVQSNIEAALKSGDNDKLLKAIKWGAIQLKNIDPKGVEVLMDMYEKFQTTATSAEDNSTTTMIELEDIAKNKFQCDLSDPGCYEKSNQYLIDRKRKGVEEIGAGAGASAAATSYQTEKDKVYDDSDSASYQIATANQSLALLDAGLYTGTGGELVSAYKVFASSMGFGEPSEAAGAEMFRVNSMKSIMSWIKDTKGAISEREMNAFALASQGLSRTEAGNRLILNTVKAVAEYQQRLETELINWNKNTKNPTKDMWRAHKKNWVLTNGFELPTQAEIDAAVNDITLSLRPDNADKYAIGEHVFWFYDDEYHLPNGDVISEDRINDIVATLEAE